MRPTVLCAISVSAVLGTVPAQVALAAPMYTFSNFSLADPIGYTHPYGINDAGQVAGYYTSATGPTNAFIYNSVTGATTTFNVPAAYGPTIPAGINNAGEVVGSYTAVPLPSSRVQRGQPYVRYTQGFSRDLSGVITILNVPAVNGVEATGINNAGQIVGNYGTYVGPGGTSGFLLDPVTGAVTTLANAPLAPGTFLPIESVQDHC